ncbi:MAG TPA: 16S rRNA (cytosine(967)-C(5))-methyltransferase RsmB, partial [Bacteroidota bacterium]|nr:16S rRNA (cytosine(967)-C(5))-methyltransferase RsmB [Bacteroidota bacterium]
EENLVQYLSVFYSHPQWIVKRWLNRFGREETEKLLIVDNEISSLTLRINKLRVSASAFLTLLDERKIQYQGSRFVDHFIKVKSLSGISQLDVFQKGYFSIQDESAAMPVLLLAPRPGERVIDMCAAPGGKTTFIGELMNNEGEILAVDKYDSRLNLITTSCQRLGITNVTSMVADSSNLSVEPADRILVDAPCSGLGTLRKKPDIKWKREPEDIPRLAAQQMTLLDNASKLLRDGGVLVYSTCTTEPEENGDLVKAFLKNHPEFHLEDAGTIVNKSIVSPEGFVETFPHRHQLDGSFAARLVKSPAGPHNSPPQQ